MSIPGTERLSASRRASDQAVAHWKSVCTDDSIPNLSSVMSANGDPYIAPHCFLLKEDTEPQYSVFIHCGDGLTKLLASEVLSQTVVELREHGIRDAFVAGVSGLAKDTEPVRQDGRYYTDEGNEFRYRGVFLPVRGDRDGFLGYVFGTFRTKAFLRAH